MIKTLWAFTRPHTIIGSFLSITTLFALCLPQWGGLLSTAWPLYGWVLLSALACNVYITGLNQLTDVGMDKLNKPFLPLASGALSMRNGWLIISISLLVCLWAGFMADWRIFFTMIAINGIGTAYSVPPIRLKRHHITAALCIVGVRGILVNYTLGSIIDDLVDPTHNARTHMLVLTLFVSVFSLAIAWFKDLYDTEGDAAYRIRTFPLLYSNALTFRVGSALLVTAYLVAIWMCWPLGMWLVGGHVALLALFLVHIWRSDTTQRTGIYRFYMGFWVFFFAEYMLFLTLNAGISR
jgi:homogentisate phytyltransferase/homogentisate geranylgeranyltransferase